MAATLRSPPIAASQTSHQWCHVKNSHRIIRAQASPAPIPALDPIHGFSMLSTFVAPGAAVEAGVTPLGRGLVSTTGAAPGTTLLSVDWANILAITDDPAADGDAFGRRVLADWQRLHGPLPPALQTYLLSPTASWASRLAAWLLWIRTHGTGVWSLYTQLLPPTPEHTCLLSYRPGDETTELQDPRLLSLAASERQQLTALHAAVFSPTTGLPGLRSLNLAPTLDDVLWAQFMVNSRCFGETIAGERVSLMVPSADFANHSPAAPAAEFRYDPGTDTFCLISQRNIDPGEEVTISYGCIAKNTAEMMKDYGFVQPGNLNDRVPLDDPRDSIPDSQGRLPPRPSLRADRLMAILEIEGGVKPGGRAFELSGRSAPDALLAAGDGPEAVSARRKVAFLMSLGGGNLRNIPKEGGVPSKEALPPMAEEEVQWERASVGELRRRVENRLHALPTSVETDEGLLKGVEGPLAPRRAAAVAARLELKWGMTAALQALDAYAESLR